MDSDGIVVRIALIYVPGIKFSGLFRIAIPKGGRGEKNLTNFSIFPWRSWWYSQFILSNLQHVRNIPSCSVFQLKHPSTLINLTLCQYWRNCAYWCWMEKLSKVSDISFIPVALYRLSELLGKKGGHWDSVLRVCAYIRCRKRSGTACVYPASLFAVGRCFMLKDLLAK